MAYKVEARVQSNLSIYCVVSTSTTTRLDSGRVAFGLGVDYVIYGRFNDGDGEDGVSSSISLAGTTDQTVVDPENLCEAFRV